MSKRFFVKTKGFVNNVNNFNSFKITNFQVNYTEDNHGKTLSIGDLNTGNQYSIPFDFILKKINEKE